MKMIGKDKVMVPVAEVDAFNQIWPCSTLRSRSYWFQFDTFGELIDTDVPEQDDGEAAGALSLLAFSFWCDNCGHK